MAEPESMYMYYRLNPTIPIHIWIVLWSICNSCYIEWCHRSIRLKINSLVASELCLISTCNHFIEFIAILFIMIKTCIFKDENHISIFARNFLMKYRKIILLGMSAVCMCTYGKKKGLINKKDVLKTC